MSTHMDNIRRMAELEAERDAALEQVIYWLERAVGAEGERDAWQRMSEQYRREAYALAAHVNRLTDAALREGSGPMVREVIDGGPGTSLAHLKAQWQAEYPMQPITFDPAGVLRFEENPIVSYLAREVSDLNHLAIWCATNKVDAKHQEQLAQLIGYSLSGYGTLSYVTDESYERAERLADELRRQAEGGDHED